MMGLLEPMGDLSAMNHRSAWLTGIQEGRTSSAKVTHHQGTSGWCDLCDRAEETAWKVPSLN